jgi:hypothetical protein
MSLIYHPKFFYYINICFSLYNFGTFYLLQQYQQFHYHHNLKDLGIKPAINDSNRNPAADG